MTAAVLVEFARIGFLDMLAFRLRYYTGVINYFINVTVYYFIWKAVFLAGPDVGGFRFPEMITYVAVGWIIRSMYFNNIDYDLASDVMEGKVSMVMLKPVSLPLTYIGKALGEAAFRLLLLTAPTALVLALLFPIGGPRSPAHFAAFAVSLAGSVLLVSGINFIVGSCSVRLISIQGLLRAKFWMQELLSGLLVPLTLFPAPVRALSAWLPFEHIGYTPMMIYLGKLSWEEIARALALEAAWIVLLLWFGGWFWGRMARTITIHGG
jgi:ABC-2 type transport system permease protein